MFGLGYALVALLSSMLVLAHVLTEWVAGLALAAAVAGLAAIAVRRAGLRAGVSELAGEARTAGLTGLLGLASVAAIAAARLGVPRNSLAGGWRYWSDGLEIADLGHIPSRTLQWGAFHPPAISKLAANAYNATLSFGLVHHPYDAMAASLWLSAAGLAAGLWALAWELGLRLGSTRPGAGRSGRAAVAGRPAVRLHHRLQAAVLRGRGHRPHVRTGGRALAIAAVRGDAGRRRALVAGGVLGAAALSHLVPTLVMAALLTAIAVGYGLLERRLRTAALALAITLAVAAGVTAGGLLVAGGDIGLGGASGGHYTLYEGRYDPTAALLGRLTKPKPKHTQRFYTSPRDVLSADFTRATFLRSTPAAMIAVLAVTLALAAAATVWGSPQVRTAVAAAAGLELLLVAAALAFSFHYAYYIQATFGTRRLFDYASLPLLVAGAAALEAGFARIPGSGWRLARPPPCSWRRSPTPVLPAYAQGSRPASPAPTWSRPPRWTRPATAGF